MSIEETLFNVSQERNGDGKVDQEERLPSMADFAAMLDNYESFRPQRGQILQGVIIKVEEKAIYIDVGAKRDAIVPFSDLDDLDEAMVQNLSPGDEVPVYVTRTPVGDEELLVSLNRGLEKQDWDRATELLDSDEALELEVVGHNKGGVLADFGRIRGFVPNSHVPQLRPYLGNSHELARQKSALVGTTLSVNVIDVEPRRKRLVLSAKAAEDERRQQRLEELVPGQDLVGTVSHIVDYGAFIDLDGVNGLLHISEVDWDHVEKPGDVFSVGDQVELRVLDVDIDRERVSLSRKALLPNPYERFANEHQVGELVEGTVTAVVDFGAFVEVADGVEGLVHSSEMHLGPETQPRDVLSRREPVLARIISMEPESERLGLSMRRVSPAEEIAWMAERRAIAEASEEEE
jgi:small subunit ribosomal protein S1